MYSGVKMTASPFWAFRVISLTEALLWVFAAASSLTPAERIGVYPVRHFGKPSAHVLYHRPPCRVGVNSTRIFLTRLI